MIGCIIRLSNTRGDYMLSHPTYAQLIMLWMIFRTVFVLTVLMLISYVLIKVRDFIKHRCQSSEIQNKQIKHQHMYHIYTYDTKKGDYL